MITEEQVRGSLREVLIPGAMRSIVNLNMIREVAVSDHLVKVTLASAALNSGTQDWIKTKVTEVLDKHIVYYTILPKRGDPRRH